MKDLLAKFEQSIMYIVIAIIYAISVFHPDVNVNEGAITELTIIVLALLAGTGKITDVISWFAVRFDFGDVTKALIKEFEVRTGSSLPHFVKEQLVEIADDLDADFTTQAKSTTKSPNVARTPDNQTNVTITGDNDQSITFDGGGGVPLTDYNSTYDDIAQG